MLDKHLIFHLCLFRLSIVVAILESVSRNQTAVCHPDKGESSCACLAHIQTVILYNGNITVYKLAGSIANNVVFAPNRSDIKLRHVGSSLYSWTVNDTFIYKWRKPVKPSNEGSKLFYSFYTSLRSTTITAKHDGVRLRYTAQLTNSTSFHSETATLRVGALPKISKSSTMFLRKLDSSVEACFNVTGIPKPLLKISKQDNNIATTSANRKEKYCVYFDLQDVNGENITVTAENCFGNSTITIDIPNFQNTLNTETSKSSNPIVSTSTDPSTLKTSLQSTTVSPHFIGATTKCTAEDKGNKTTSDLPDVVSIVSQNRFVSTEIGCQFVSIQPTSTTDICEYVVRLTNVHKQSELELSLSSNNNLFLEQLEENTAYTVEIRARNRHGLGPTSSIYVFQTTSCADEKTNLRLRAAVATLAAFFIIPLILAAYLFYRLRRVTALGGAKESNTMEMNVQEPRHDAATYETVSDSSRQPDVLTRSPLYEETSVIDNPSYGVVPDPN